MDELNNKKIAVLGLGIEGVALTQFLYDKVAHITVFDQKNEQELLAGIDGHSLLSFQTVLNNNKIKKILNFSLDDLIVDDFDIIFRSPSVYFNHPKLIEAREKGIQISSQMNLFFDLCPCRIVGVTGTKGKGTTASLIFEILKTNSKLETRNSKQIQNSNDINSKQISDSKPTVFLAGNIGTEVLSLLKDLKQDDVVVLELSNFQLADLTKSPYVAVVTNLGTDHLDYHKNVSEYHQAKESILKYQGRGDWAVLNLNSTFDQSFTEEIKSKILYFSTTDEKSAKSVVRQVEGKLGVFLKRGDSREVIVCRQDEIKIVGRHNLENIAAASIVADIFDVDIDIIRTTVKDSKGLPYRLELIAEVNGVKYINDSFATNPGPTMAAIRSFENNKIMILGGSSKGSDFGEMAKLIADQNVKAVLLIGVEGNKIRDSLVKVEYRKIIEDGFTDLFGAVTRANEIATSGDLVIFSPACASFDMFKNYKDRGEKFNQAVAEIKKIK